MLLWFTQMISGLGSAMGVVVTAVSSVVSAVVTGFISIIFYNTK